MAKYTPEEIDSQTNEIYRKPYDRFPMIGKNQYDEGYHIHLLEKLIVTGLLILMVIVLNFKDYITQQYRITEETASFNLGVDYINQGKYQDALKTFNETLKMNPDLYKGYYNRGLAYFNLGNSDEALADFNHAIELNSQYAEAYWGRGLVYYSMAVTETDHTQQQVYSRQSLYDLQMAKSLDSVLKLRVDSIIIELETMNAPQKP